jgi:MoaA/NifB/PqqE/SkfB family radical SAM enzyme
MSAALSTWTRLAGGVISNMAAGEAVYPAYVSLKVTRRCPLRCPFCNAWASGAADELSTAELERVVRNVARSGALVLVLEGGEPLLRDDIEQVIRCSTQAGLVTAVVTALPSPVPATALRCADYVQVSIDEGHDNVQLFQELPGLVARLGVPIGVQTVVRRDDVGGMAEKVRLARASGVKIVLMPAVDLHSGARCAPDRQEFVEDVRQLKRRFPGTVVTSDMFLKTYGSTGRCSTASLVVDADGGLYYPCHLVGEKPTNLLRQDLREFVATDTARRARSRMRDCERWCGWYQYFTLSCCRMADAPSDIRTTLERRRR